MSGNMKQTVDQLEAVVADAAKMRVIDEKAARPAQTTAEAIANHTNAIVDRATQEALDSIRALRKRLDDAERMILDNAARLQMEVKSHVNLATLAQAAASSIADQIADHRASHAELVGAVTRAA